MRNYSATTDAEYWSALLSIILAIAIIGGCSEYFRKPIPTYRPAPGARR